jgi:hypothetical protein
VLQVCRLLHTPHVPNWMFRPQSASVSHKNRCLLAIPIWSPLLQPRLSSLFIWRQCINNYCRYISVEREGRIILYNEQPLIYDAESTTKIKYRYVYDMTTETVSSLGHGKIISCVKVQSTPSPGGVNNEKTSQLGRSPAGIQTTYPLNSSPLYSRSVNWIRPGL